MNSILTGRNSNRHLNKHHSLIRSVLFPFPWIITLLKTSRSHIITSKISTLICIYNLPSSNIASVVVGKTGRTSLDLLHFCREPALKIGHISRLIVHTWFHRTPRILSSSQNTFFRPAFPMSLLYSKPNLMGSLRGKIAASNVYISLQSRKREFHPKNNSSTRGAKQKINSFSLPSPRLGSLQRGSHNSRSRRS